MGKHKMYYVKAFYIVLTIITAVIIYPANKTLSSYKNISSYSNQSSLKYHHVNIIKGDDEAVSELDKNKLKKIKLNHSRRRVQGSLTVKEENYQPENYYNQQSSKPNIVVHALYNSIPLRC